MLVVLNKDLVELVTLKDTRVVKLKVQEMNSVLWKSTDVGTFDCYLASESAVLVWSKLGKLNPVGDDLVDQENIAEWQVDALAEEEITVDK